MNPDRHTCDRKAPAKVIGDPGDEPITHIYPRCRCLRGLGSGKAEMRAAIIGAILSPLSRE
jgi:hypothetical protein